MAQFNTFIHYKVTIFNNTKSWLILWLQYFECMGFDKFDQPEEDSDDGDLIHWHILRTFSKFEII